MDYEKVKNLVLSAKKIILDKLNELDVRLKGKADFVTAIDFAVNSYLCKELKNLYPEIGMMSEENTLNTLSESYWILDPIDGTTNLVFGQRECAVSLALCEKGVITFGIIFNPFTDEMFYAQLGKGAYLNGKKINVSKRALCDSIVAVGTAPYYRKYEKQSMDLIRIIYSKTLDFRRIGSSAIELAYIACGRIDGCYEFILKPWDYGAGVLILSEAGGLATDFNGIKPQYSVNSSFVASNGIIHNDLLHILKTE